MTDRIEARVERAAYDFLPQLLPLPDDETEPAGFPRHHQLCPLKCSVEVGQTDAMSFRSPPESACWLHRGLRTGFEVAFFTSSGFGVRVEGTTTGLQDGAMWVARYVIDLDESWCSRSAEVTTTFSGGSQLTRLESDGVGYWTVNGETATHLDGCYDVDLESSAMTNAFPVHRLSLPVGGSADATAAYVRLEDARVERLAQRYARGVDRHDHQRYAYEAPAFDFSSELVYDGSGLVLEYPGIATRAG